jgi:hypothetical protein
MYKVIGGDQKEYGPASLDEIRQWITDGRLSRRSMVQAEGGSEWKPASSFPEFAGAFRAQGGDPGASPPPFLTSDDAMACLCAAPQLDVGRCLSRAWQLMIRHFGLLFAGTFLVWMIGFVCQFIPLVGMAYLVLRGVFYGGLILIFLNCIRNRPAAVGDVFAPFKTNALQLMLAGVITGFLSWLGLLFCLLPGIYLMVAWSLTLPLVADKRLDFWPAMELSRKVATRVWFKLFALLLVAFLPTVLILLFTQVKFSSLMFGILHGTVGGGQVDLPRMMEAVTQIARNTMPLVMTGKVVLLLNLPFALGALTYAYEDLFGARTTRDP